MGNLKNLPNADMITIKVPPEDLRPMIVASEYGHPESMGAASSRHTPRAAQGREAEPAAKRRRGVAAADGAAAEGSLIVSRFIYASRVAS